MLVEELLRRQRAAGLTDLAFATILGVEMTTWEKTRRGLIPARLAILQGEVRAFPDLGELTLAELAREHPPRQRQRRQMKDVVE